ncbi:MAG: glutamine synthetase beta-grasp domain-containing protein [Oscillospiraceae bacterium]|jgi:glutamine synthetase|nr:glutamine synthetase beta-grasp domain-containing protein [Oscillospiraceae bacterium]
MQNSINDVLRFVKDRDNDVKFVRLAFCDRHGAPKNISVPPDVLSRAFNDGIPFEPGAIQGFGDGYERALLFPDASTLAILPWRPQHGRVVRFYCDLKLPDGAPAPFDTRAALRQVIAGSEIALNAEPEIDFYLFRTGQDGEATEIPFDDGGYFDVFPRDMGENVRREICFHLGEMGIHPTSSHHARGPGQNTITLSPTDLLTAADNLLTFRMTVGTVAGQNGLAASFEPAPISGAAESFLKITLHSPKSEDGYTRIFSPSVNPYTTMEEMLRTATNWTAH